MCGLNDVESVDSHLHVGRMFAEKVLPLVPYCTDEVQSVGLLAWRLHVSRLFLDT